MSKGLRNLSRKIASLTPLLEPASSEDDVPIGIPHITIPSDIEPGITHYATGHPSYVEETDIGHNYCCEVSFKGAHSSYTDSEQATVNLKVSKYLKEYEALDRGEYPPYITEAKFGPFDSSSVEWAAKELNRDLGFQAGLGILVVLKLMVFYYQLKRSRNGFDTSAAILAFGLGSGMDMYVSAELLNSIKRHFDDMHTKDILTIKSESRAEKFDSFLGGARSIMSGALGTLFRDLALTLVSQKFVARKYQKRIIQTFGEAPRMSFVELIEHLGKCMSKLMHMIESIEQGVPIVDVFCKQDPVTGTIREADNLLVYEDHLYTGLPVDGYMCQRQFLTDLEIIITKLKTYEKNMSERDSSISSLRNCLIKCLRARLTATNMSDGKFRDAPYAIILHGPPGIGKSKILPFAARVFSEVKGRRFNANQIYTRVKTSDYYAGYQPYSQPFIHFSELGSKAPHLAKSHGDDVITELTSLVDDLNCPVDMPFEGKGKTFALPEMVLVDTNNKLLNLKDLVYAPGAYMRRFLYINPVVKPEYRRDGTMSLDPMKSCADESNILDRWTFNVTKYVALDNHRTEEITCIPADSDIYALEKFLREEYTSHIQHAVRRRERLDADIDAIVSESKDLDSLDVKQIPGWEHRYNLAPDRSFSVSPLDTAKAYLSAYAPVCTNIFKLIRAFLIYVSCSVLYIWMGNSTEYVDEKSLLVLISFAGFYVHWFCPFLLYSAGAYALGKHGTHDLAFIALLYQMIFGNKLFVFIYLLVISMSIPSYLVRWKWGISSFLVRKKLSYILTTYHSSLKIDSSRILMKLGLVKYTPLIETSRLSNLRVCAAATTLVCTSMVLLKYAYHEDPKTEASTLFHAKSSYNKSINDLEEKCGVDLPYDRVRVRDTNIWNTVDCLKQSGRTKNSIAQIYRHVSKNLRTTIVYGEKKIETRVLGVCGNFALINRHAFGNHSTDFIEVHVATAGLDRLENTHWKITQVPVRNLYVFSGDLVMIELNQIQFRDIRSYFVNGDVEGHLSMSCVIDGESTRASLLGSTTIVDDSMGNIKFERLFSYVWTNHRVGHCGTPLVIDYGGGSVIAGIHVGGSVGSMHGFSTPITRDLIDAGCARLLEESTMHPIYSESSSITTLLPLAKSPFRYEDLRGLHYYGRIDKHTLINQKSSVRLTPYARLFETILNDTLRDYDGKYKYGPPIMKPYGRGDDFRSPYNEALRKMNRDRTALNPTILSRVIDKITKRIVSKFEHRTLSPITMDAAINGAQNDCYLRSMNTSTASGFGWDKSKSHYLPIVDSSDRQIREPIGDLKKKISSNLQAYENHTTKGVFFNGVLKDEARSRKKIESCSTRVFYVSPIESIVVSRMFLSPFYTLMVEENETFCTAVGINIYSGTDSLIKRLTDFSPLFMEGDYGAFDIGMPFDIGRAANTVVRKTLAELGYNEKALAIVDGLLTDNLFPTISLCNDLFQVPGLQPSGKYATAEDNSLRNLIMLLYAWESNSNVAGLDFFDYVMPVTYGDDIVCAVKEDVINFYNNSTYQVFCKENYNLDYTAADKSATISTYLDIDHISFLKRSFVDSPIHKRWIAPIEKSSLLKSMCLYIPSKNVSKEKQLLDSVRAFMWEWYLHVDEIEYTKTRKSLLTELPILLGTTRDNVAQTIPIYDDISEVIFGS